MGGPWCTFKRSRGPNVPADNYQLTPGFLTHILCRTFHPSSWNLTSRCFGDLVFVYVSFEVLPLSRAKVNRTWIDFPDDWQDLTQMHRNKSENTRLLTN